jgi:putative cell wall-binding protein
MRSVIAALGVLALTFGLMAYGPGAQGQAPPQQPTDGQGSIAQANSPIDLVRHAGKTRFETSAEIATDSYDASTDVVIASGEEFADALAGAALEGMLDAPVLLVPRDLIAGGIPPAITNAIDELGAVNATILGGTNAVSGDVEDFIVNNSTVTNTERVAGATRFETAEQVAQEVGDSGSVPDAVADEFNLSQDSNAAFLATGLVFADALAGGPGSFAGQHPILLTGPNELHPAAQRGLEATNTDVVFILGGSGVVSSGTKTELQNQGYDTVRLSGSNRFATAKKVADTFADDFGFGVADVGLATGEKFADALASAPLLGNNPAPLLLTPTNRDDSSTHEFFTDRGCNIETMDIFGGEAAVAQSVAERYAEDACTQSEGEVQSYTVDLSWVNEVDDSNPDDPQFFQGEAEAEGTAELTVDEQSDEIDFTLSWDGVTPPFDSGPGAHIHSGAFDENGPIEVFLGTGDDLQDGADNGTGSISGTVTELADSSTFDSMDALTEAINNNPSNFYVNEHSDDFAAPGAIRGQLPNGGGDTVMDSLDLTSSLDPTEGGPGTEVEVTLSGDDVDQIAAVSEFATFDVTGDCISDQTVDLTFSGGEGTGTVTIADDAGTGTCTLNFTLTVNPSTSFSNTFTVLGSTAGTSQTDAPELVDVQLQREFDDTVRYAFEFDSSVSTQGLSEDNFFLHAWDGTSVSAINVVRDDRGDDDGFTQLEDDTVRAVFHKDFTEYDDYTNTPPDTEDDAAREYFTHLGQWVQSVTPESDAPSSVPPYSRPGPSVRGADGAYQSTDDWEAARRAEWTDVTTASIRHEAVRDLEDERLRSPEAAIGIDSHTLEGHKTQWPTLEKVENFDTVDNTAEFVFDRDLSDKEESNILAMPHRQFWLIREGGTTASQQQEGEYEFQSTAVTDVDGDTVTVEFADPVHSPDFLTSSVIDSFKRAFVEENAFDDNEDPNDTTSLMTPAQTTTASPMTDVDGDDIDNAASNGLTARPDLVDFSIDYETDEVTYTFDEAVEHVFSQGPDSTHPPGLFLVQYRNGQTVYGATAGTRPDASDPSEVVVEFPDGSMTKAIVNVGVTTLREDESAGDGGPVTPDTCDDTSVGRTSGLRHFICNSAASDTGNDTWVEPRLLPNNYTFEEKETLAPNLQSVEVAVVDVNDATSNVVEREVRYDFDRPLQIHDTRPETDAASTGEMTFTLYDTDGARRTARATQCNVTTADSDASTVIFSTDGPCGSGSTYSLAGAGDSVVGGVVFGNEQEVEGDGDDKGIFSGVLSNDPANSDHDAASRNDQDTFEEARVRRAYSWLWVTNYESTEAVVESDES